ncbi:nucleotide-binding protein [Streptomyces malaysiensis]|uniref:AAA family ATPase n=1 Tax=Streptomyces malaysiensis subsp. samsunensis TaxID=459658 RepID=A0A9X2S124_STRMQ|nr:AAA family ATPase [Streptomyces samsunensis]MCQ8835784.1 AAA family ATPase [Streptomyces samsunensis]
MRIAFVGKGGSGKTTLSGLFARHLARSGAPVVAIDADINQHLGTALGLDEDELREAVPLSTRLIEIKEYLRGDNPRIPSAEAMVKTTPPGTGSRLLRLLGTDPVHTRHIREVAGVGLLTTGVFTEEDLGVACYHSKLGAVELYLNHLVDDAGEYVVVDMTAGADSFASGLFTRFDMTFLVAEPTRKGVSVYHQYRDHATEFGVPLAVVGNKVTGEDDRLFLKEHIGDDLLVCFGHSDWVRAREQGRHTGALEPEHRLALDELRTAVDSRTKDWETFQRQAIEFHLSNAHAWANSSTGQDLSTQIDPDFRHGPTALPGNHTPEAHAGTLG